MKNMAVISIKEAKRALNEDRPEDLRLRLRCADRYVRNLEYDYEWLEKMAYGLGACVVFLGAAVVVLSVYILGGI